MKLSSGLYDNFSYGENVGLQISEHLGYVRAALIEIKDELSLDSIDVFLPEIEKALREIEARERGYRREFEEAARDPRFQAMKTFFTDRSEEELDAIASDPRSSVIKGFFPHKSREWEAIRAEMLLWRKLWIAYENERQERGGTNPILQNTSIGDDLLLSPSQESGSFNSIGATISALSGLVQESRSEMEETQSGFWGLVSKILNKFTRQAKENAKDTHIGAGAPSPGVFPVSADLVANMIQQIEGSLGAAAGNLLDGFDASGESAVNSAGGAIAELSGKVQDTSTEIKEMQSTTWRILEELFQKTAKQSEQTANSVNIDWADTSKKMSQFAQSFHSEFSTIFGPESATIINNFTGSIANAEV